MSRLRTIFFLIITATLPLFAGVSTGFAENTDNPTDTNFVIHVSDMSPTGSNGGDHGGVQALRDVIKYVANILLFMIPILAAIAGVVAGYYYIFSGGSENRTNIAKGIIKWNLIAILVAFFSWSIVNMIASFF